MKFIDRHLGPDSAEREEMLCTLGYENVQDLVRAAIPESIALDKELDLPEALDENTAQERLRTFAQQNTVLKSFYGQGFHDTITPPVIRRGLVEDPAWYTAYTPYQPEISQGRLEALLNFQTMVQDLTGLPIANASLLDESSAVAEAVGLMSRVVKKGRRVVLDSRLHPQILSVAAERARALELEVSIADLRQGLPAKDDLIGVVFAYIGTEGDIADPRSIITEIRERGGLATVTADLLSLLLLEGPGNFDADVVVGSSQRFGVPLFFGGPHAAFMSVTDKLKRQLPGRLVGVSKDADGTPAYRLSLQTREQHIRRERATSNICTAQALLANVASMYAVYHGPRGLRGIAKRVHELAASFAAAIVGSGGEIVSTDFLDTVTVSGVNAAKIKAKLQEEGYLVRAIGETKISVSFGESATPDDVAVLARACGASVPSVAEYELPADLLRTSDVLTHKVFNTIHSETQMMRYLRKLSDKDLALDRTMIPLGSCTMKLNPTAAMEPISWPEFAHIHPFAPSSTTQGWQRLIAELETWLAEVTGYAKVSIQPNAGSQGELAGLLAIRRYHVANGNEDRGIILIPASAHGTNAASATLANLRVVVIKTAADGSIDVADLDEKISQHAGHIAGIMITYPSTHGVFDPEVRMVCEKVHAAGGQVYIDGANMNALCGWAQPGQFGGDVSHLNLHKTFTIPHGGGGPGVGPVCVAEHLVPFLPTDAADTDFDATTPAPHTGGVPVAATRFGSAGVLPISWAYLAMMGADGLKEATADAILGANYIAHELKDSFPILYTGNKGLVAHECILDLRALSDASGVTAADVAKRLIDFGFHAPTLAFPVAGTLMVEPTESEDLAELNRFIEAMRTIRAEIDEIIDGTVSYADSVIHHAPFTAESVSSDSWEYTFSRKKAAWPVASLRHNKYFPPVRRLDEAYGDRNLVCSCPPPEAFELAESKETGK